MSFRKLYERTFVEVDDYLAANVLTVPAHLRLMAEAVRRREPICHVRFNDGECAAAFKMFPPEQVNGDDHHYFPDVGEALLRMLDEVAVPDPRVLFGSFALWYNDYPIGRALCDHLGDRFQSIRLTGELWCQEWEPIGTDEMLDLLDALRESGRAVLVSNDLVRDARHCIAAEHVSVPLRDAWLDRDRVRRECFAHAERNPEAVFAWCGGYLAKVLSWETFKRFPRTTHLDFGSTFDGAFGHESREWLRKQESPMWTCYRDVFIPYVRGFVP